MANATCRMNECPARTFKHNLCLGHHFEVLNRSWDDLWAQVRVQPEQLGGCWVWTGPKDADGYGLIPMAGRNRAAHRVSYELINGTVAHGFVLDHLCRNKPCVNPEHLEPVTRVENLLRTFGIEKDDGYPYCNAHHKITDKTVKRFPATGERQCLTCVSDVERKWERSGFRGY